MEVERVQAIALKSKSIDSIPSEFVQTEQPTVTTELEVPTIDLSEHDESKAVELIAKASKEWGLFQIVNHGIPNEAIAKLQQVGKDFFELPQEEKEVYASPVDGGVYKGGEGYGGQLRAHNNNNNNNNNNKKGWNDHLFHKIWPPSAVDYRFWPNNPPSYREANEEYGKHLRGVTDKLLKYLSKGLGVEDGALKEGGGGDDIIYLMKINYYPPCPRPDLAFGVLPHTDMSLLTILVPNDVPGLQVCRDDVWYDVRYIPNALIIHIGDQIEIMSNGEYKAVYHRTTVNKDKTRMSWPVFIEPPADHAVGPIPELVSEEKPAKFKTKKFSDYKYCKLNKLPM